MKTLTAEMKEYLLRGMREELEKDTTEHKDEDVRWHIGMYHETTNTVRMWLECVELEQEEDADYHFSVLEKATQWWKDYFDVGPGYARQQEIQRRIDIAEAFAAEKEQRERDAIATFEQL